MNVYHLKLDLYSESTTHTAPTSPSSSPRPLQQADTPTAASLATRFRTLLRPFPQPQHQALDIRSSSLESSQSPATASARSDNTRTQRAINHKSHASQTSQFTDYRLGSILISSLDEPTPFSTSTSQTSKDKAGAQKHKSTKAKKMTTNTVALPGRSLGFQDAEPAQGILRLYKDTNEITTGDLHIQSAAEEAKEASTATSTETTGHSPDRDGSQTIHPDQGTAVCVLAVPSYMSPGDFLNFVGPVRANVSHFRIIRDAVPNRFMVLMKFRTSGSTSEFYAHYNGKAFSSLEPEICHVVYLKTIEIRAGCMPPYAFPFLNEDPFLQNKSPTSTTAAISTSATLGSTTALPDNDTIATDSNSTQLIQSVTASTDPAGLAELPTCPVCLERMDSSVTGLLTILCQHTFHCHCLSKWGEGSCPVCRYSQKSIKKSSTTTTAAGGGLTATTDGMTEDQNECALCGTTENLWICLICGHIGCGRYQEKHAYHHYYDTSHLYALELETQRVWDYAGDGYVHRLIQNKADGKLVELPSAVDGTVPSQHAVQVGQEKLDAIGLEYTYLLTSQLESQRLYFDAQMAAMAAQLAQMNKEAKEWEKEATELNERNRELALMAESLEKERVPTLIKEKKATEKRLEKLQERLQLMERQYEEEKEMNVGLRSNQDSFKEKLQLKEAEIMDLQEQVRDMMIYLDTQQRVEASPIKDELVNGTVGVMMAPGGSVPAVSSSSSSHSRRKGGRK
ncbi:hypothetical protein BGZ67_010418 [Mortierella alpina]|nr:hypothetical protein BGZ67_010418 [Mortierella alpina]